MIRPPVFLGRPSAWGLILLLAMVPVGYGLGLYTLSSLHIISASLIPSRGCGTKPYKLNEDRGEVASFYYGWQQNALNYSLAYQSDQRKKSIQFFDRHSAESFEKTFWPESIRNRNCKIVVGDYFYSCKSKHGNKIVIEGVTKFVPINVNVDPSIIYTTAEIIETANGYRVVSFKPLEVFDQEIIDDFFQSISKSKPNNISIKTASKLKSAAYHFIYGHHEESLLEATQVLNEEPNSLTALIIRMSAYQELGKFQKAESDCSRAIELNPSLDGLYAVRASLRTELKKYSQAIEDLNFKIKADPKKSCWYVDRSYCLSSLGRRKEAQSDMMTAISLDKNDKTLLYYSDYLKEPSGKIFNPNTTTRY